MSKRSLNIFLTLIIGLMFVLGEAICLYAQETKSEEFTLEEITVTAQKRSENQQKVAIAMDVIPASDLKALGKVSIDDILSSVTNVMVQKAPDGMRVSLHGYADQTPAGHNQSTSTPAVAVNVDGVYSNRKDSGMAMYDMERVEVLFGPQSTMYASNSPGGIVNIWSASPKLDKYEASGTLEYGSFNLLHMEGMVNAPISSTVSLRTSFLTQTHDGYVSNGTDDEDVKSARVKLLYQPMDKFSATLTAEIIKQQTHQTGSAVVAFVDQSDVSNPWLASGQIKDPDINLSKKINARIDGDLGFATLSLTANYAKHKGSRNELMNDPFLGVTINTKYKTFGKEDGVELVLNSSADSFLKWIVGLNYYYADDWQDGLAYNNATGALLTYPGNTIVYQNYPALNFLGPDEPNYRYTGGVEKAKAAFANVTYPVTDAFRVKAGIRYSKDDYTFHNSEIRGSTDPAFPPGTMEDTKGSTTGTPYSSPDYSAGVEYDLAKDNMLYLTYATSYKVAGLGGGRPGHAGNEVLPPEKLQAFTFGSKNRFFDKTLQFNASGFYYLYKNFNASDMVVMWQGHNPPTADEIAHSNLYSKPGDPGGSAFGKGTWYGADIQSTYLIGGNDQVNLNLSYLHSEWTDLVFRYESPYLSIAPFMSQAPLTAADIIPGASAPKVMNGKPMTFSPAWTVALSYTHKFNFESGASIDARLDTKYKSAYEMTWRHDKDYPNNYQEAFVNGDFTATYFSADGKWNFSAYCKNLRDYAEKRSWFGEPANELRIGPPRTFGGIISVKF
jgi:iron complex outermembrane recepter protein